MGMTALALVNAARGELGLIPDLTTLVGSTSAAQLKSLLDGLGRDLVSDRDWVLLQRQATIQTVAPLVTTGDTTLGSASLTNVASIAGLNDGWVVTGTGVARAARVVSASVTTVVTDSASTATGAGVDLTFSRDTFAVPADFEKMVDDTQWDRSNQWKMIGPDSPQSYQYLTSGVIAMGPRVRFLQVAFGTGRGMRIWPPPTAVDAPATLAYNYISNYWVLSAAGAGKNSITVDTDTFLFPDVLLIAGLKAKLWRAQGFDSTAYDMDYARVLAKVRGQDRGGKITQADRRRGPFLISSANAPEGNFPGPP